MGTVTLAARALIAAVFAIAAAAKLPDPGGSRATFREFGVGEGLARFAVLLAPAELVVAIGLMIVSTARWAAFGAVLLLLAFIVGMINALRLSRRPDCGCLGGFRPAPIGRATVIRNGVLVATAGLVAVLGPGPSLDHWLASHSAGFVALVAILILAAAAGLMLVGGTTASSPDDDTGQRLPEAQRPTAGDPAPDFSASDISGELRTLSSLREAGRPIVIVFGNSSCGWCLSLFGDLGRWQRTLAERLSIVLVGSGDPEQMKGVCDQYGIAQALLDSEHTVWRAYGMNATPSAFVVSADGIIEGGPAIGPDAIEDLIRLFLHRDQPMSSTWKRTINAA
jgi:peroxiredoxin/uncharacterized membrane protein YphA (DoxX/SURF4 family)